MTVQEAKAFVATEVTAYKNAIQQEAETRLKTEWQQKIGEEEQRVLREYGEKPSTEAIDGVYENMRNKLEEDAMKKFAEMPIRNPEQREALEARWGRAGKKGREIFGDSKKLFGEQTGNYEQDESLLRGMAADYGFGNERSWNAMRSKFEDRYEAYYEKGQKGMFQFIVEMFQDLSGAERTASAQTRAERERQRRAGGGQRRAGGGQQRSGGGQRTNQ